MAAQGPSRLPRAQKAAPPPPPPPTPDNPGPPHVTVAKLHAGADGTTRSVYPKTTPAAGHDGYGPHWPRLEAPRKRRPPRHAAPAGPVEVSETAG